MNENNEIHSESAPDPRLVAVEGGLQRLGLRSDMRVSQEKKKSIETGPMRDWRKMTVITRQDNGNITPLRLQESEKYTGGGLRNEEYVDCPTTSLEEKMYRDLLIQDVLDYEGYVRTYGQPGSTIAVESCHLLLRPGGLCRPAIVYRINGQLITVFGRDRELIELASEYGQTRGAAFFTAAAARMEELGRDFVGASPDAIPNDVTILRDTFFNMIANVHSLRSLPARPPRYEGSSNSWVYDFPYTINYRSGRSSTIESHVLRVRLAQDGFVGSIGLLKRQSDGSESLVGEPGELNFDLQRLKAQRATLMEKLRSRVE